MELYRIETPPVPYGVWIVGAAFMILVAVIANRKKQPFYGRLVGAGLFLAMPVLPLSWLNGGLAPVTIMLFAAMIDVLLDRSSKIVPRFAIGILGFAFVAFLLAMSYKTAGQSTFAWRVSETSIRLENGRHETIAQVDRQKARILEAGKKPDRFWIVKDGSGEQFEAREIQTYLDKNNTRLPAEEVIRKLEAWTGRPRERK